MASMLLSSIIIAIIILRFRVSDGPILDLSLLLSSLAWLGLSPTWGTAAPAGGAEAAALFQRHCQRCHGADGSGRTGAADGLPNFTRAAWHGQRSDAELVVSIRDGKGAGMPSFSGRFSEAQVEGLIEYIRAFAPASSPVASRSAGTRPGDAFARQMRQLQNEYDELERQLRELRAASQPRRQLLRAAARAPLGAREGAALFRLHCQRCHGPDGKGQPAQVVADARPDFSRRAWHKRRTDAQLLASILEGTEEGMPAFKRKISKAQAQALVAYVRGFAPRTPTLPAEPSAPAAAPCSAQVLPAGPIPEPPFSRRRIATMPVKGRPERVAAFFSLGLFGSSPPDAFPKRKEAMPDPKVLR